VREFGTKSFPYQELSEGVQVWNSTCNTSGIKSVQLGLCKQIREARTQQGGKQTEQVGIEAGQKTTKNREELRRERVMQELNQATEQVVQTERRRVEAVVETLATMRSDGESLAELAHDARNMVTALGLYCDLLEEPGVLATQYSHYGNELRLVAAASRRLVEKLVALDVRGSVIRASMGGGQAVRGAKAARQPASLKATRTESTADAPAGKDTAEWAAIPQARTSQVASSAAGSGAGLLSGVAPAGGWDLMPPELISNLAQELLLSRNLLAALAGPSIALTVDVEGGALPVRLNGEDLTRVLVNLVKNAAEAIPGSGSIRIGLRKQPHPAEGAEALSVTVEDSGPGIPRKVIERIFEAGFTTRAAGSSTGTPSGEWPSAHRGLGLSISRSIVEAAGGRIYATNREGPGASGRGARFEIVLPVRSR
jgi:signal transduction histidine kinase